MRIVLWFTTLPTAPPPPFKMAKADKADKKNKTKESKSNKVSKPVASTKKVEGTPAAAKKVPITSKEILAKAKVRHRRFFIDTEINAIHTGDCC